MSTVQGLFIVVWLFLTAIVTLAGGGCPGFIVMFLIGCWIESGLPRLKEDR